MSIATLTGENGLLTKAQEAKNKNSEAGARDKISVEVLASFGTDGKIQLEKLKKNIGKIGGTIVGEEFPVSVSLEDSEFKISENGIVSISEFVQAGNIAKTTVKNNYKDSSGEFATIPKGFTVSNIESEKKVSTGLVIYDIPEGKKIEWNQDLSKYNQFVWVPVLEEEYNRTAFGEDLVWAYYKEPDDMANNIAEYESIKNQILKYGGFYIARYESAFFINDTGLIYCKSVPSIKYNTEEWEKTKANNGTLFNYITWREAMKYSNEMYQDNKNVKSNFLFGTQWDSILKWIEKVNSIAIYDEQYGNYTGTLINSGQNIQYKVNNIFDLAGNLKEWTQEFQSWASKRIVRGGSYQKNEISNKMVTREMLTSTTKDSTLGFRVSLVIQ